MGLDEFDFSYDVLTPEIIKEISGLDVVLIDTSQPGWKRDATRELSEAMDVNGKPLDLTNDQIFEMLEGEDNTLAATPGLAMQTQVIIYNSDLAFDLNSPNGLAQIAFGFQGPDPEYVADTAMFEHPALLANIAILTEVSHGLWQRKPETLELYNTSDAQAWLDNSKNQNDPGYLSRIAAGQDQEFAAKNTIIDNINKDGILKEVQGDVDAVNEVKKWAETYNRPDVVEAVQDFVALRVAMGMTHHNHRIAADLTIEQDPAKSAIANNYKARFNLPHEDVVVGLASILQQQGHQFASTQDIFAMDSVIRKAANILTVAQSDSIEPGSAHLFVPSLSRMHDDILDVVRTREFPDLSDGDHRLLPKDDVEKQQIIDVMVAFGISIERLTPNFNGINGPKSDSTISLNSDTSNWGIDASQGQWSFGADLSGQAPQMEQTPVFKQ